MPQQWWQAERDPLPAAMVGLMAVTGMVDAVSFLGLDQVFTGNMTGNITLLGFAIAGAGGLEAGGHILALAAFVVGAVLVTRLLGRFDGFTRRRWLLVVTSANALVLLGAAIIGWGQPLNSPLREAAPVIALLALAMGGRIAWFHRLHQADLTGSVVTITLTGLVTDTPVAGGAPVRPLRRAAAILSLLVGAITGAAVLLHHGIGWAILLAAVTTPLIGVVHALHPGSARPVSGEG